MANGFLRALAKVKLVELDEAEERKVSEAPDPADDPEIQRMVAEAERAQTSAPSKGRRASAPSASSPSAPSAPGSSKAAPSASASSKAAPSAPAPSASAAPSTPAAGAAEIAEGVPFETYYAQSSVPEAPYPAEKLLRLLDGLRAMDSVTRKSAVLAMDAADDNWAIADIVLDAQRKTRALTQADEALQSQLAAIVERGRQEKDAREKYLAAATATIRQKIADLEQTLQREIAEIAAQKAQIDAQVEAAEGACRRESARLQAERQRLSEIAATFVISRPTP